MRVPQPDIIEHFGNADAVPQLPERCLSRKAGIVRCCLKFQATKQGDLRMIYLDYSANTPVDPRVLEVYCRTEQNFIGNPNSTHCAGQAARQEMNRVTGLIAA